ncbi:MAG: DUF6340 family protein [Tannerellaceae bacterium]|jgi:hypothetical protein|nr:DUF6340 family protein [Tannerellaceae bacterium]
MEKTFCLFLLTALLAACTSMRYIGIDTYNPAEITYPEGVGTVLVVNNALPQDPASGCEFKLLGVDQDTCRMQADSALFDLCRTLGKTIFETGFFHDVVLFEECTREDGFFLSDQKLTAEQVVSLCEEAEADAVISLDRMLFRMKKNVSAFAEGYVHGEIKVEVNAVLRTYLPGREQPMATLLVSDSLFWGEYADNAGTLDDVLPPPDEALRTVGAYVGEKVYAYFVPHWASSIRWYYIGGFGTQWKEASALAANEKWEQAGERWQQINARATNWQAKAKSASNIALAYELKDEINTALEWAEKSYRLFEENKGNDHKDTQLAKSYVDALTDRIRAGEKLKVQFGEE